MAVGSKIIYDGEKHRDHPASRLVLVAILAVVAGICIYELIAAVARDELPTVTLIAPAPIAFVAWAVYSVFQRHYALPVSVNVLETGFVRFQTRDGEETFAAEQFYLIEYAYHDSEGTLVLRTSEKAWHLPCSDDEAERVIAAIVSLNPDVKIERREDSGMAG